MDDVQQALKDWERRSLQFLSVIGLGLCLFYIVISLQLPMRGFDMFHGPRVLFPLIVTFLAGLVFLHYNRGVTAVGYAIATVLIGLSAVYPHYFYWVTGVERVGPEFILKSTQVVFGPIFIAFIALTFRPALAIYTAVGIIGLHLVNVAYVMADPRTIVTDDPAFGLMGPALLEARIFAETALMTIAGVIAVAVTFAARRTVRQAVLFERANGHLRRYFSPDVADQLVATQAWPSETSGVAREVVILFSDIVNFTAIAENMTPTETVQLLSDYRDRMVAEIFARRGTLDKFIGDGILAVYGTFGSIEDAPDRAVETALAMHAALDGMNAHRRARGLPLIRQRIGLHCGPALVGNVAAAGRMEFTVIGDTVNVASRIEQAGKTYGETILLSNAVARGLSKPQICHPLGVVPLPGHHEPVELYAIRPGEGGTGNSVERLAHLKAVQAGE